jgi:Protein kinase domain
VIGTPAYMSPEQAGGMLVDARSDIYSLGAIMYELFCGQPMFRGRSFGEYVRKHLTEMPIPPRATAGGAQIEPRLEQLILRCLEKDPNGRFSNIVELRDALLGMLGGLETHPPSLVMTGSGIRVNPTIVPHAMQTVLPSAPMQHLPTPASGMHPSLYYSQYASQIAPPPAPAVTPWWVWFVGGALAVGLGIGAAVFYAGRGSSEPTTVTAAPREPAVTKPAIVASAIEPAPAPVVKQKLLEVKFDSLPSGGVYAGGRSAELCRTPCTYNIELDDGGSTEQRMFVVRAEGYQDSVIVVDLAGTKRDFQATLERAVTEVAAEPDKPVRRPFKKREKPEKKPVTTAEEPKKDPAVNTKKDDLIDPTDGTVKRPVTVDKKVDKKPATIDPTDLADPFKNRKR